MSADGLHVALTDDSEVGRISAARTHWIVMFGRNHIDYIDKLDDALGVFPTFPTVIGPVVMTLIPKSRVGRRRMNRALMQIGAESGLGPDRDVAIVTDDMSELTLMARHLQELTSAIGRRTR